MRALAGWHWCCVRECDAATVNLKLMAYEQRLCNVDPKCLYAFSTCTMHGVQHIVEQIMKAAIDWDDVRKGLSALAHLFGMGTYFLRFVLTVQRVVSVQDGGLLRIVKGDSPPEAIERSKLLRKYFSRLQKTSGSTTRKGRRRRRRRRRSNHRSDKRQRLLNTRRCAVSMRNFSMATRQGLS